MSTILSDYIKLNFFSQSAIRKLFKMPSVMQCPSCREVIDTFDVRNGYIGECGKCNNANIDYIRIIKKFDCKSCIGLPTIKHKINIRLGPHYICTPLGLCFNESPYDKFYPLLQISCKMKTDEEELEWYYGIFIIDNETYYGFISSKYILLRL